ncbi:nucleoside triphosphate pyrophosphohydrolase [Thioalkalivibrio sp. HK1]|uniref:nucleoside triphosphate pyrophosphohydrolase n=1 Tax=Thioalkalivibrio sp. HK1 TaxID=1469245 RepID=UPI00056FD1A0|nr:nucleoside triphosphate pyrophosphohydrolase [Thioalkalivibrio sp. HK1]
MSRMDELLGIMMRLRDPKSGCPWDREQTFRTIAPYTIEEAYEVADAIERDCADDLADELGDLLFQVVFHAQLAREAGIFDFDDVVSAIIDKMVRRHPHVFRHERMPDAQQQIASWETMKAAERSADPSMRSHLDGIPVALPALSKATKLQSRAARCGFDWSDAQGVLDKLAEEKEELAEAVASGEKASIEEEIGDMFFTLVNLARHLGVDPEVAARSANRKFERRFRALEEEVRREERAAAAGDAPIPKQPIESLERLWSSIKDRQRESSSSKG